jgi:hypothetical protein
MEDCYKMFTIVIKNLLVKIPVPETTGIQKRNVKRNNKSMQQKLSLLMKTILNKNYL